jgi:DNA-binding HxlR family transcriptional regulator
MFDYAEFCPISKTATIVGERWTIQIIREMHFGVTRFSEFQKYLPRISPSLLNTRLRSLEENGIIIRKKIKERKGYEYLLSPSGKALLPLILEMGKWGVRYVYDSLSDEELNAERLVRDVSTTIDTSELPSGDTVLRFKFFDLENYSYWYIKIHDGDVEVCDGVPENEIDVYITSTLATFTKVWMGSVDLHSAMDNGNLRIVGNDSYTRNLSRWLRLNQFAPENPNYKTT